MEPVEDFSIFDGFSCGDEDLDEFIAKDAVAYAEELLAVTYSFRMKSGEDLTPPIAFASIMNDAIRIRTNRQRRSLPYLKRTLPQYPAVKIGRLGVFTAFQGMHIGKAVLSGFKDFFLNNNRTGCRYMTVDAYKDAVKFYEKNDFQILAEAPEKEKTVSMFLDLKRVHVQRN